VRQDRSRPVHAERLADGRRGAGFTAAWALGVSGEGTAGAEAATVLVDGRHARPAPVHAFFKHFKITNISCVF
jgi:hypothetical protein